MDSRLYYLPCPVLIGFVFEGDALPIVLFFGLNFVEELEGGSGSKLDFVLFVGPLSAVALLMVGDWKIFGYFMRLLSFGFD